MYSSLCRWSNNGGGGDQPVDGCFQLCLVAGSGLGRLVFDVAFALVCPWDDDGQDVLFTNTVAGAADTVVTWLIMLVIREADRIED